MREAKSSAVQTTISPKAGEQVSIFPKTGKLTDRLRIKKNNYGTIASREAREPSSRALKRVSQSGKSSKSAKQKPIVAGGTKVRGVDGKPRTLQSSESILSRWTRLGAIGCIKKAPSDLSTNQKYLEGLGEP